MENVVLLSYIVTNLKNNALKAGNQHWAQLHNLAQQENSQMAE